MSEVESGSREGEEVMRRLYYMPKKCHILGITGWPGVGKSSLINAIARVYLKDNQNVGIIAIDPTSPFSFGSLLGDRERMREIDENENVFIRSLPTRGHTGGIAPSANAMIKIMEVMGKDIIILESVGVGQDQTSISLIADTVIVVTIPGIGDYLQALKAGVLEIGDIYVVNKADREGAGQAAADLNGMMHLQRRKDGWFPPIIQTIAIGGNGIDSLMAQIVKHKQYCMGDSTVLAKRKSAMKAEIVETVKTRIIRAITESDDFEKLIETYAKEICEGRFDPYTAADEIIKKRTLFSEN